MFTDRDSTGDRLRAVIPVAAIHAGLAFVLLRGLAGGGTFEEPEALKLVSLPPPEEVLPELEPPPPPPPAAGRAQPLRQADPRPEAAASPPNLKAEPAPIVAPDPVIPLERPKTVVAAQTPGTGAAASAGAADVRGPGTGSGGVGTGRGSGRGGGGLGGGGGGGGGGNGRAFTMPRQIRGDFSYGDIPDQLQDTGFAGRVFLRFLIDVDGRAKQCRPVRSSGSRLMDAAACRAVEQRFRFMPGRDESGRPVPVAGELNPFFEAEGAPPDEPPPRRRRMGW